MENIVPSVFLILMLFSLVCMVACIFTPKAAFILKNKTRKRGILAWAAIAFLSFVGIGITAPHVEVKDAPKAISKSSEAKTDAKSLPVQEAKKETPVQETVKENVSDVMASILPLADIAAKNAEEKLKDSSVSQAANPQKAIAPAKKAAQETTRPRAAEIQKQPAVTAKPKQERVQRGQLAANARYSGNVKTYKFHSPGCRYYNCRDCVRAFNSRDEAFAAGYDACKKCGGR